MAEDSLQNTIIHLLGFPGAGKYTIAQEIAAQGGVRLVDNHLINNPLFSLIQLDGKTKLPPRIWDNVRQIWAAVADTMVHISPPHFSFVLTNALVEHDAEDRLHMENMCRVATERKGVYVPVRIDIRDVEEHVRRITSPQRRLRMKETDAAKPRHYAETKEILKTGHPNELTLDVTSLSPADSARAILAHARKCR